MQDFIFYLSLGWEHIISLDALDHQLFLLALVAAYSVSEWRKILILVTAFTIGHSITLAVSVLDIFRIPSEWVEFLIPLSILITSVENLFNKNQKKGLHLRLHYLFALLFGLIHGMGFANTARMAIASEQDIAVPLLGFNIGLELGQILVVALILAVNYLILNKFEINKRYWIATVSIAVALMSLKMCVERFPLFS